MAKPLPVTGLDADRRLRPNARKILAVRIAEVWSYSDAIADPARVRELHDMRIACKRLRYLLEIFAVAFPTDLGPYIDEVKVLQDVLGDIHDRDVQVPMLHGHLSHLAEHDATAADGASRTGSERPGILALIDLRVREREDLYTRFLEIWRRLDGQGFRAGLETALGI